jgi:hypothetical protein
MGATRATLRRTTGRLCGDLIVIRPTSVGTTTTLIDTVRGVAGDNAFVGRQAYYVDGHTSNEGVTRRVTANVESTGTITTTAFAQASAVDDTIELYASRGVSPTPDEIHDKINDLIRSVADKNLVVVDSTDADFDAESPYIDIPSTWIGVCGAQWQDDLDEWHDIRKADRPLHLNLGTYGQVELTGAARWLANTHSVHLIGVTPAPELTSASSSTIVNSEWLCKQAAFELLVQNSRAYDDAAGAERRGLAWRDDARLARPMAQTKPPANFQRTNRQ